MNAADIMKQLEAIIASRRNADPRLSYVARLLHKGEDTILKKIGEEATEVVIAAKSHDKEKIIYETADLVFHTMVMLAYYNLNVDDVVNELARREGMSGLVEKAARVDFLDASSPVGRHPSRLNDA
jgi:phosphoribosyl-ATP pyrophosphohydrolase